MIGVIAAGDLVGASVPISRFNRGGAGKIFQEVSKTGIKIVFKNNRPECVLLSPETFEEISEALEDYRLHIEAEERMGKACKDDFVTAEEAMKELGITETDLETANAEIG